MPYPGQVAPKPTGFRVGQRHQIVAENNVYRKASLHEKVHQGAVCGKTLNYSLSPHGSQVLKSPQYPAGFSPQTQCVWQLQTPPGFRVKLEIEVFNIITSGNGCTSTYLEFSDPEFGPADTNGARSMVLGDGGSFKLCGKNPGTIVSNGNALTLTLHADENGDSNQRFFIRLSATKDRPRVLRTDGQAVTNGRAKGEPVMPVVPARGPHRGSIMGPVGNSAMMPVGPNFPVNNRHHFTTANPALGQPRFVQDYDTEGETEHHVDIRMKNMGIMFLIIAITILLICAAVVTRRKLIEKKNHNDEKVIDKEPVKAPPSK